MYQKVVIPNMNPESSLFNRSCKPYLNLDFLFTVRPAGRPGITTRGFTLIELLVVVLIIGILAAVALPQYETAVLKARLQQQLLFLHAAARGQEMFYLANGRYAFSFDELDVELPEPVRKEENSARYVYKNFYCFMSMRNEMPVGAICSLPQSHVFMSYARTSGTGKNVLSCPTKKPLLVRTLKSLGFSEKDGELKMFF